MVPNTMAAKLCELAAVQHEMKRKAKEMGWEEDGEEVELCGIVAGMEEAGRGGKRRRREGGGGGEGEERGRGEEG